MLLFSCRQPASLAKVLQTNLQSSQPPPIIGLAPEVLRQLYVDCIKLATDNKINDKNAWSLRLIDHLPDLIRANCIEAEQEEGSSCNFQKAGTAIDAGAKIYAKRVDDVHGNVYKTLQGFHRAKGPSETGKQVVNVHLKAAYWCGGTQVKPLV